MYQSTVKTAAPATLSPVQITVSEDKMTVYAQITDFSLPLREIAAHLKKELLENGIRRGLIKANVEKLLKDKDPNQKLLIAKGLFPREGKMGSIVPLANFSKRADFDIEKLSVPDIEVLKHPNLVFTNTPLVKVVAGRESQKGYTVTGETLEPNTRISDPTPKIELGQNVTFSKEDPNVVVATCDGLAILQDDAFVDVIPYRVIHGTAGYEYNGLTHEGSIIILGDVRAGVEIEATEDIEVYGTVEDARLKAGRDIIIYHGFVGRGKGKISAQRNAILGFALYQEIKAGNVLLFFRELMGCRVFAGKCILSIAGGIIGGVSEAQEKICIQFAGSEEAVKTDLIVGQPNRLKQHKQQLETEIETSQKEIEQSKEILYELVRKQLDDQLEPDEAELLEELQARKKMLPDKIRELETELTRVNEQIKKLVHAYVEIRGPIYERVSVTIGEGRLLIDEKNRSKKLRLSGKLVLMSSL